MIAKRPALLLGALLLGAAGPAGTWQGSYGCAQGTTGVTLVIRDDGEALAGYFAFYAVPDNPGVPEGCYRLRGTVTGHRVRLQGGAWILRPADYVTVDLDGQMVGDRFTGRVDGPACDTFSVTRVEGPRAIPVQCRGAAVAAR